MAALTPVQRMLFYMIYEEGYNQTEVAAMIAPLTQRRISSEIQAAARTSASVAYFGIPGLRERIEQLTYPTNV